MSEVTRLLIVDSHQLFRECLASFLIKQGGLAVLAQAGDAVEALDKTELLKPDIVLIGVSLSESVALSLTYEISSQRPHSKLIIIGIPDKEQTVIKYVEAGASGYTLKHNSVQDLLQAINLVCRGEALCSPRIAYSMFARIAQLSEPSYKQAGVQLSSLTAREREILQLIAEGLSNKQIAEKLYISLSTVKNHVHNILEKLEVRSRADAANYAVSKESPKRRHASV